MRHSTTVGCISLPVSGKGGSRPKGPYLPVVKWWSDTVRAEREAQGMSQETLGKKVGVSKGAISNLENGREQTSRLVEPISRILGISTPITEVSDEDLGRWNDLGKTLKARDPADFFRELARIATKPSKKP